MPEHHPENPPTLTPQKARQGRRGSPVLMVLIGGLVLAMIVWGAVEIYGWAIQPSQEEQVGDPATVEPAETNTTTAPAPADQ